MVLGWTLIPTPGEIVVLGRNPGVIPGFTKYPEPRIPGEVAHLAWGPRRVPSGLPFLKYGQIVIIWNISEYYRAIEFWAGPMAGGHCPVLALEHGWQA